ncbi:MAG: sensor histidine kinase [Candidatus Nanohaloarchaea archaeon]
MEIKTKIAGSLLALVVVTGLLLGTLGVTALQNAERKATNTAQKEVRQITESRLTAVRDAKVNKYNQMLGEVEHDAKAAAHWIQYRYDGLPSDEAFHYQNESKDTAKIGFYVPPNNTYGVRHAPGQQDELTKLSYVGHYLRGVVKNSDLVTFGYHWSERVNSQATVVYETNISGTLWAGPGPQDNVKLIGVNRPYYEQAKAKDHGVWVRPYVDANTGQLTTTYAEPVYASPEEEEFVGVVGLDVLFSTLQNDLLSLDGMPEGSFGFLLDSTGKPVVYPGVSGKDDQKKTRYGERTLNTTDLTTAEDADIRSIANSMVNGETGISEATFQNRTYLVAYAPLKNSTGGWSVALAVPKSEVTQPVRNIGSEIGSVLQRTQRQMITGGILAVVLAGIVGFYVSRRITSPIEELTEEANEIARGNFVDVDVDTDDEVGELADAIRGMVKSLKQMAGEESGSE